MYVKLNALVAVLDEKIEELSQFAALSTVNTTANFLFYCIVYTHRRMNFW